MELWSILLWKLTETGGRQPGESLLEIKLITIQLKCRTFPAGKVSVWFYTILRSMFLVCAGLSELDQLNTEDEMSEWLTSTRIMQQGSRTTQAIHAVHCYSDSLAEYLYNNWKHLLYRTHHIRFFFYWYLAYNSDLTSFHCLIRYVFSWEKSCSLLFPWVRLD